MNYDASWMCGCLLCWRRVEKANYAKMEFGFQHKQLTNMSVNSIHSP